MAHFIDKTSLARLFTKAGFTQRLKVGIYSLTLVQFFGAVIYVIEKVVVDRSNVQQRWEGADIEEIVAIHKNGKNLLQTIGMLVHQVLHLYHLSLLLVN